MASRMKEDGSSVKMLGSVKRENISEATTSNDENLQKRFKGELNSTHARAKTPMHDIRGDFFLDKEIVPIALYQEGLMFNNWNPTQVLYELATQCQWSTPEFTQLDYTVGLGFLFGVCVNNCYFCGEERGKTKKEAQHHASAKFLQFLGFKLSYNVAKPSVACDRMTGQGLWHEEIRTTNDSRSGCSEYRTLMHESQYRGNIHYESSCEPWSNTNSHPWIGNGSADYYDV